MKLIIAVLTAFVLCYMPLMAGEAGDQKAGFSYLNIINESPTEVSLELSIAENDRIQGKGDLGIFMHLEVTKSGEIVKARKVDLYELSEVEYTFLVDPTFLIILEAREPGLLRSGSFNPAKADTVAEAMVGNLQIRFEDESVRFANTNRLRVLVDGKPSPKSVVKKPAEFGGKGEHAITLLFRNVK